MTEPTLPESPLNEASPKSLDELFDRDPLDLADEDVDTIITTMRTNRALWLKLEEDAAAQGKRVSAPRAKKPKAPAPSLTITDLEL